MLAGSPASAAVPRASTHCLEHALGYAQPLQATHTFADALEHAAWTKGSRHMQPLRDDLNWFQHSSLDVILFVAAVAAATMAAAVVAAIRWSKQLVSWLGKARQGDGAHAHAA